MRFACQVGLLVILLQVVSATFLFTCPEHRRRRKTKTVSHALDSSSSQSVSHKWWRVRWMQDTAVRSNEEERPKGKRQPVALRGGGGGDTWHPKHNCIKQIVVMLWAFRGILSVAVGVGCHNVSCLRTLNWLPCDPVAAHDSRWDHSREICCIFIIKILLLSKRKRANGKLQSFLIGAVYPKSK